MARRHHRSRELAVAENPGLFDSSFAQTAVGVAGGILLANVVVWVVSGITSAVSSRPA